MTQELRFVENHTIIHIKIILSAIGCLLALVSSVLSQLSCFAFRLIRKIAHYYPGPWPENRKVTIYCIILYPLFFLFFTAPIIPLSQNFYSAIICLDISYVIVSGISQFLSAFVEKDTILTTLVLAFLRFLLGKTHGKILQPHPKYDKNAGVIVSSSLPRYSEYYTLSVRFDRPNSQKVSATSSIGKFFDADGYFHEEPFCEFVKNLVTTGLKKKSE
jgi:hypothetical protein